MNWLLAFRNIPNPSCVLYNIFTQIYLILINFTQFIVDCPSCAGELLDAAGSCVGQVGYGLIACIQEFMDPEHPCFDCITDVVENSSSHKAWREYLQSQIKNMDQIQQ